jgi:hypothetical protein
VVTWGVALAIWHFGHLEEKWDLRAAQSRAAEGLSAGG